ncbi:MAG TPA: succinate dehydrogenase/fumarate reductase iron-sulfur subunit [Gemmatimonas sp.]|nr:succinate dehydrogenase/fumarate reductase iron-sulfur subunit [Gemmatimonas sp.]
MKLTLKVWRQAGPNAPGALESHVVDGVEEDMSFLEMFDMLNDQLTLSGGDPVAFQHDCREGICGSCAMMINGQAHGPWKGAAACQLHMRAFKDGDEIVVEPWRATAFPIIKDLAVNRGSFDRIIQAGGYISVNTGGARDANEILIGKDIVEHAMDAAACIACGACVAACPNASAALFTGAKITHLGDLPQGQPERDKRALAMVDQMDIEGFGHCTLVGECQEACPKEISIDVIKRMNRDYIVASVKREEPRAVAGSS